MTEEKIRQQLSETLESDPNNYTRIIELSKILSSFDATSVRFSVDAGVINRLGKELVGRHETAVSELVKNAYDADATDVKLIFKKAYKKGGTLEIQDNGVGMTRDQLINGFMRLSSSDKIHNPKSPRYNRTRAGRKGIGRFATQRLGSKLTVITQTKDSELAVKVVISWDEFEMDKDLSSVSNSIEFVPKLKMEGTDLIIEKLRDSWSDAMIKRVYRYTSELLQPFPLSKSRKQEDKQKVDPGFKSTYYRDNYNNKIIDEEEAFLNHALAEIEGFVLKDGQGCWSLQSDKLNFDQETFLIGKDRSDSESKYNYIKGVHFKCYYFIYTSSLIPTRTLNFIRDVANERGGIRLYRNGFRVLPYGEKLNDWLGLDDSSGKRTILSSHRNANFFGFVEVTDDSGVVFDETSSREGLFENEALKELVDFVHRSIITGVQKVAELRGKKVTSGQKGYTKEISASEQVEAAIAKIKKIFDNPIYKEQLINEPIKSIEIRKSFEEAFDDFDYARKKELQEKDELLNEISMLRILAGLGLVIGEYVHEIKRFLPGFSADINYLKNIVKDYPKAIDRVERLGINVKSFSAYTSYFDKAISRNVFRELVKIEIKDAVNDFQETVKNDLKRSNIKLNKPVFNGFDLFTVPMHVSEWSSILFNLYTNSKKAIKRKGSLGTLHINCGRENGNIFLEFSDNGDGISEDIANDIFNEFFTTTSAAAISSSEIDSLTGTGLGLKIVKDIVESYNGNIFVKPPLTGFETTIRIEIPEFDKLKEDE